MKPLFLLLAAAAAVPACAIRGTVLDAETGKPVAGARVYARYDSTKAAVLRVTGAQGAFCFEQLAPQSYEVVTHHAGYLVSVYGGRPGSDDGIPFHIEENTEEPPLEIRLLAGASIAGTVFDADGATLTDENVQLSRKVWDKGWTTDLVSETNPDENGSFRFSMLAPGTYYLSAAPRMGLAHGATVLDAQGKPVHRHQAETFYSGSYTFPHATPIRLKAGQEYAGLVLTMLPPAQRHLSGRLTGMHWTPLTRVELMTDDRMGENAEIPVGPDGAFSAEGLDPVEYRVQVSQTDAAANGHVDLSGGDVSGFVIEPARLLEFNVTARMEGQGALPPIFAIDRASGVGLDPAREDKRLLHFANIPSGIYRIGPIQSGYYVKSLRVDGRAPASQWLDLRQGAPGAIEMTIESSTAAVEGQLKLAEGETHALAITVVAVDESRSGDELIDETTVAEHTGEFSLDSLAPGKWRLFAIEGFEEGPWGSPELAASLAEKSATVELAAGAPKKNVSLPVISAAEWDAALRKMGM